MNRTRYIQFEFYHNKIYPLPPNGHQQSSDRFLQIRAIILKKPSVFRYSSPHLTGAKSETAQYYQRMVRGEEVTASRVSTETQIAIAMQQVIALERRSNTGLVDFVFNAPAFECRARSSPTSNVLRTKWYEIFRRQLPEWLYVCLLSK